MTDANLPVELNPVEKLLVEFIPPGFDINKGMVFANPEEIRPKLLAFGEALRSLPGDELTQIRTSHRFADGLYIREVFIPKGKIVEGKIHKLSSPAFMCIGDKLTFSEDGIFRLQAPFSTISKPGVKRIGIALEDTVWTTVHPNPTNTRDIKEIEKAIFADSYDDVPESHVDTSEVITMEGFKPCQEF